MGRAFFKYRKRILLYTSVIGVSAATSIFFQNCSASKFSSTSNLGQGAVADSSAVDNNQVNHQMDNSGTSKNALSNPKLPVGSIGGAVTADQARQTADSLIPGFTISQNEIKSIQNLNSDSANKAIICKLFARPQVELGQTISFMVLTYNADGTENFEGFKDVSGSYFKFPKSGSSRIEFVGTNNINGVVSSIREKAFQETQRLGNAVYNYEDSKLAGTYTRAVEVYDQNGHLYCRSNTVTIQLLSDEQKIARKANTSGECLSQDVAMAATEFKGKKVCPSYRILGAEGDSMPVSNSISVSDFYGSKESSSQAFSRMQGAEYCHSGRALVSKIKDTGTGSFLVENECLD